MTRFILFAALLPLAACGYSTEEYALNRSALAPGIGVMGGAVKDINPVSGQIIGAGVTAGSAMPARSLVNPAYERYAGEGPYSFNRSRSRDPYRPWR
jgi:predicted metal-dependent phosphoesterase TrpH